MYKLKIFWQIWNGIQDVQIENILVNLKWKTKSKNWKYSEDVEMKTQCTNWKHSIMLKWNVSRANLKHFNFATISKFYPKMFFSVTFVKISNIRQFKRSVTKVSLKQLKAMNAALWSNEEVPNDNTFQYAYSHFYIIQGNTVLLPLKSIITQYGIPLWYMLVHPHLNTPMSHQLISTQTIWTQILRKTTTDSDQLSLNRNSPRQTQRQNPIHGHNIKLKYHDLGKSQEWIKESKMYKLKTF